MKIGFLLIHLYYFITVIASRDLTVLQLVENLQQDLLNEQASHRCKSVVAFALVLDHLIPELIGLNNKEVELVTEFFCSKLKDHHSIIPAALQGIHALVLHCSL